MIMKVDKENFSPAPKLVSGKGKLKTRTEEKPKNNE